MAANTWEFDNSQKAKQHTITNENFILEVQRLKDQWNNEEKISVTAYWKEGTGKMLLGTTRIDPTDIEAGLVAFKKYGVMLSRPDCIEIARHIREQYYSIEPTFSYDGHIIDKNSLRDILSLLHNMIESNHIQEIKIKPRHMPQDCNVYAIPVKTFSEELQRSQLSKITPKAIQEYLFQNGYTLVNRGCLEYVAPVGEDKVKTKCVCLYKDKFDAAVEDAEA